MELCQLDKVYLHQLSNYNKILLQRNRLLKDLAFRPDDKSVLDVLDLQLVKYGRQIIRIRKSFVEELDELMVRIHDKLSGGREKMALGYECNVSEEDFEKELARGRERDLRLKTTSTGPHRDDISFLVNGIDIRKYGSQGQQRTSALSLKLSEIELVKKRVHDTPVLLLDDVLSELDGSRQNYLLNYIHNIQTLITCTGLDEFINNRFSVDRIYRVSGGMVTVENGQEADE